MTYAIDDRDDRFVWLRLRGPEGTKEFVRAWLPKEVLADRASSLAGIEEMKS